MIENEVGRKIANVGIGATLGRSAYRRARARLASAVKSTVSNRHIYTVDLLLSAAALVLAMWLRLGPQMFTTEISEPRSLIVILVAFVGMCGIIFPLAGLYKRKWEYASISDYIVIVEATLVTSLVLMTLIFLFSHFAIVAHSIIAIEIMVLISFLTGARLTFRHDLRTIGGLQHAAKVEIQPHVPVLLVGAGHEADLYLRALQRDPTCVHKPVGFLNTSPEETGSTLRGVPVLGSTDEFNSIVDELAGQGQRPRHLIFTSALSSLDEGEAQRLIASADRLGMAVSRLNPVTELRNPRAKGEFELRPIELTDLLERPQASLDVAALQRFIHGRRVMITGAGGSIGSELSRQVAALDPSCLILIDNCEFNLYSIDLDIAESFPGIERCVHYCDVREKCRVDALFAKYKPELVFHAAALKHVPLVELNPCEGVLTNVFGTLNVAEAVKRWGALCMVQISTDKVVNSPNVMGSTKRLAELYCQALDLDGADNPAAPRFMTVRFGNVLGSSGSLIPLFKRQLARGGPLTVTHPDMMRFFMTIREAVELTLQASAYGLEKNLGGGQIFVLDMGEPIKIIDIARRMIRLAGFVPDRDVNIEIVGCRPGEKLFEELFDDTEQRVMPPVPGVLGAVPTPVPLAVLYDTFEHLRRSAMEGDTASVFNAMNIILSPRHHQRNGSLN